MGNIRILPPIIGTCMEQNAENQMDTDVSSVVERVYDFPILDVLLQGSLEPGIISGPYEIRVFLFMEITVSQGKVTLILNGGTHTTVSLTPDKPKMSVVRAF